MQAWHSLIALLCLSTVCHAQTARRWDFNKSGDREGWTVPASARGAVFGGSVWLTLTLKETDPTKMSTAAYQIWGDGKARDIELLSSPDELNLNAADITQVRMRVVNLSSLTDFFIRWKTNDQGWGKESIEQIVSPMGDRETSHARRCSLKADIKQWQEITCYIDPRSPDTIQQISLLSPQTWIRGNLWIDSIEIGKADPPPKNERPDVASGKVIPHISIPGISQEGFTDAFKVLDECLITEVPIYGFNYPVMSPGGIYHRGGWWQLDSSVNVTGAKWVNQAFAEGVMRGFSELQDANLDGRIDYSGWYGLRGQIGDVSMLPSYFEVAYDVARRTDDPALRQRIFNTMARFVDWWLSPTKTDKRTGLVTGTFEEKFPHIDRHGKTTQAAIFPLMTVAPVDLNVAVAVGAKLTAQLAQDLRKTEEAARYTMVFEALARAINTHMWDDKAGAYYDYSLQEGKLRSGLNVTTFDPLRFNIAPRSRQQRLLKRLLDPKQFNWGDRFLTSWSRADPDFIEEKGMNSVLAWYGDVWALRNSVITAGLEESGRHDLAAELNWSTIRNFHSNYYEYVSPSTGQGYGAQRYGMSASLYIGAIVEHLFGVDYDRLQKRLTITPHIAKELYGKDLALENLVLPNSESTRLSVFIKQTNEKTAQLTMRITGPLPEGSVEFALPGASKHFVVPIRSELTVRFP